MRKHFWIIIITLLLATPAVAQTASSDRESTAESSPRVTVFAGASMQAGTLSFNDITTLPYFAETARIDGSYSVRNGTAIDVGGSVRIWRGLGAGISVTTLKRPANTDVSATYPHPFFYNRDRTGSWPYGGLQLQETGIHVSAVYFARTQPHFAVMLFGGPTFFNFRQGVVMDVNVVETYPYDSINASLSRSEITGRAIGFHAGGDISWYFGRNIGVGGLVRLASGKKNTTIGEGEPFDLTLGGVQAGGGVRLRF